MIGFPPPKSFITPAKPASKQLLTEEVQANEQWKEQPIRREVYKNRYKLLGAALATTILTALIGTKNAIQPGNTPQIEAQKPVVEVVVDKIKAVPHDLPTFIVGELLLMTVLADLITKKIDQSRYNMAKHEATHLLAAFAQSDKVKLLKLQNVPTEETNFPYFESEFQDSYPENPTNFEFVDHKIRNLILTSAPSAMSELINAFPPIKNSSIDKNVIDEQLWQIAEVITGKDKPNTETRKIYDDIHSKLHATAKNLLKQYDPQEVKKLFKEIATKDSFSAEELLAIGKKFDLERQAPPLSDYVLTLLEKYSITTK